jgi:hypothetical protein
MPTAASLVALAFIGLSTFPSAATPRAPHDRLAAACISPERTGTYRVFASKPDGSQSVAAMLVLENIAGCLEASFLAGDRGPAIIDNLSVSGDTLRGSLNVTGNPARVTFQFNGNTVVGTIVDRRQEWRVEGKRTT